MIFAFMHNKDTDIRINLQYCKYFHDQRKLELVNIFTKIFFVDIKELTSVLRLMTFSIAIL